MSYVLYFGLALTKGTQHTEKIMCLLYGDQRQPPSNTKHSIELSLPLDQKDGTLPHKNNFLNGRYGTNIKYQLDLNGPFRLNWDPKILCPGPP